MTEAATREQDVRRDSDAAPSQGAARRAVLLCAGLAGAGAAIAGCSTAAVPYDANDAGQAPGVTEATSAAVASGPAASGPAAAGPAASESAAAKGSGPTGTVLGEAAAVPVGGGMVYTTAKVVVTQPKKGVYKAFSAICTHVACLCDQVADGTINCPCHGSKFKITDGAVVAGPAPAALPAAKITVSDGKILLQ